MISWQADWKFIFGGRRWKRHPRGTLRNGEQFSQIGVRAVNPSVHFVGAIEDDVKDVAVPFGYHAGLFVGHGARS